MIQPHVTFTAVRTLVSTLAIVSAAALLAPERPPAAAEKKVLELRQEDAPRQKEQQKYPDTAGIDVVTDAPWRVVRRQNAGWIPLLIFVPDANLADRGFTWQPRLFRGFKFKRITVYDGRQILYEDTDQAEPSAGKHFRVLDEDGKVVTSDIAGGEDRCGVPKRDAKKDAGAPQRPEAPACDVRKPGGWHRVIQIPLSGFSGKDTVFLKTEIVMEAVYDPPIKTEAVYFSRTLRVQIADDEFPSLGPNWRYFDVHMHTIAEWSLDTKLLAPRKAYGGPLEMIKQSAWAMGLVNWRAGDDGFKNRVIVTDHNAFFSDGWTIDVGPTKVAPDVPVGERGRREFENMRRAFGTTFGEEVTLETPFAEDGVNFGSHLLLMRSDHRDGPWHGGLLSFKIFDVNLGRVFGGEENTNSLDAVLKGAGAHAGAFAYAAHPLAKGNHWNAHGRAKYLDLLHDNSRAYVTPEPEPKFVLKGAQYWNEKPWLELRAQKDDGVWNIDFFDLHPFDSAPATPLPKELNFKVNATYPIFKPNPLWDAELQEGLIDWHRRIRSLLRFSFADAPEEVFPRKIYLSGGSDAHGDFNYSTTLLATVLDKEIFRQYGLSRRSVTSNGFGIVRTYVDSAGKPGSGVEDQALNALSDGNSVVTDGPVLTFSLDSDARFDTDRLAWRDDFKPVRGPSGRLTALHSFNDNGRIGGNGRYDGGFTALVAKGTRHAIIRYRWNNSSEFGPPFGGTPDELHLYLDAPAKPVETVEQSRQMGAVLSTVTTVRPFLTLKPDRTERDRDVFFPLEMPELAFDTPVALSMAIFAKKGSVDFRGYTNPIWVVPVEITPRTTRTGRRIPRGGLKITFTFGMSMMPDSYEVMLLPLNERGESTGRGVRLAPDDQFGRNGWGRNARDHVSNAVYQVTNAGDEIDAEVSNTGGRFAVVLIRPKDLNGNELNSLATDIILSEKGDPLR